MAYEKPNARYWIEKTLAYLHDPFDKPFKIRGHQERARRLMEMLVQQAPNEEDWKLADGIAASFARGIVPEHSNDPETTGSIPFLENGNGYVTHPVGNASPLSIQMEIQPKQLSDEIFTFVQKTVEEALSGKNWTHDERVRAQFFYLHLVLRFALAENNVGGLGALWHRLPADTRFPDHSIWHHNALTSAIYSAGKDSNYSNLGLMVFSITPVQEFIARARKVRDYWTGSVLLSWLAFEGIRWVMEHLGPDHILYPSLIDQPLVVSYLEKEYGFPVPRIFQRFDIASFPNKFVVLIPFQHAEEIGQGIADHIRTQWLDLSKQSSDLLTSFLDSDARGRVAKQFLSQTESFWDLQWAASRLVTLNDMTEMSKLMDPALYRKNLEVAGLFKTLVKEHFQENFTGMGILYSQSHSLAQGALAAGKLKRSSDRDPQPGVKCSMCHEFEVLHDISAPENLSAQQYEDRIALFWQRVQENWRKTGYRYDFDENPANGNPTEKLCGICTIKRIGYAVFRKNKHHILFETFRNIEKIPSTTELALYDYFRRNNIPEHERAELAQKMHEKDTLPDVRNADRYYAILQMDGDFMGKLINGEQIESSWESTMHPAMVRKILEKKLDPKFLDVWLKLLNEQRLLTPDIHAAISESLGDFALYHVSRIVEKYDGRLVYAGGDDVCAFFPVDTVLPAALEIRESYHHIFDLVQRSGNSFQVEKVERVDQSVLQSGKLSVMPGGKEKITISGAILVCHHKEDLKSMMRHSHELLDRVAKEKAGRNALAVEVKKRSGGSRIIARKWDDRCWENMIKLGKMIKASENISMSLAYKFVDWKDGFESIITGNYPETEKESLVLEYIRTFLDSSVTSSDVKPALCQSIRYVLFDEKLSMHTFAPDGLIISTMFTRKEAKQ